VDNKIEIFRNNNEEEPDLLIRSLPTIENEDSVSSLTKIKKTKNKFASMGNGLEIKLDLNNIQKTMENSRSAKDITIKKGALSDRGNKLKEFLTLEKRTNSVKNLHSKTKREDMPSNSLMQKSASAERFKILVPSDNPMATLYNVKLDLNINNKIFNNNYVTNYITPKNEKMTNIKTLEKLYLSSNSSRKDKFIKQDKLAKSTGSSSGNRFYSETPKTIIKTSSKVESKKRDPTPFKLSRNNSESRTLSETSMKRIKSESKIDNYKPGISPSPSTTRLNNLNREGSTNFSKTVDKKSISPSKAVIKKSQSKKKIFKV
jgi:hypothetical protein